MKWAVTGAAGMLGTDLVDVLRAAGHEARALTRTDLDIRDLDACRDAFAGCDVVVNAAAWTDVDGAEVHEAAAFAVNAVGAANVGRASREVGAVMVQPSTDYVFSGSATAPYTVDAPVAPINAYGRSKAAGEWAVRAESPRSYLVRTAWLYGAHGHSFVRTMLRLAREGKPVDVVDDQVGQPTWTRDLAGHLVHLVDSDAPYGIRHSTSRGRCSWYDLARAVYEEAGTDPALVRPVTSESYPRAAARPRYSVLEGDSQLPDWRESLRTALPHLMRA